MTYLAAAAVPIIVTARELAQERSVRAHHETLHQLE
jgi:hypothetical protein